MSCVIVIRDYKPNDAPFVTEVVRSAYLTNVSLTWFNALTREITFQLIVMFAAILFIIIGVPLLYCLIAIPLVVVVLYMAIYSSYLIKAAELMHSKKPVHCWVAEACEPFIFIQKPEQVSYKIVSESKASDEGFDMGSYKRKIIGTVAISRHLHLDNSGWLFRLAVISSYRQKGVGHALVRTVQNWCREQKYENIELAMSECQESSRQLFVDTGFDMRQLYHKHLLGSAVTLLMYQLGCNLSSTKLDL